MTQKHSHIKKQQQARRLRTRLRINRSNQRPRLTIFRSSRHIYAQIIDDRKEQTMVSSSTMLREFKALKAPLRGVKASKWVGTDIAKKAIAGGIKEVAFDRGQYMYHGQVKSLAEAARDEGLKF